ncbi:ATP phosphoribosyltransferase [Dokdonella sp.]|uniref:ATP phosphoribosyltransferase n=1 Tax=Dokdonella sp. TaxID=2291710 RepID=UPI0031C1E41F|nr:ATP phosphoribosyltransferase [Dokdonella sp.]
MKPRERLRVATQKSGRLTAPGRALLARAGLEFAAGRERLFCLGESLPIDLLLVRDDDIPGLLHDGTCELGLVGRDVLEERRAAQAAGGERPALVELRALGFGQCRLSIALPVDAAWDGPLTLQGARIATSHPALLHAWLRDNCVNAEVVTLSGSVEIAPRLGKAEAICDLVSSGATLAANQLREVAVVLRSEAVLAGTHAAFGDARDALRDLLLRRIDGALGGQDARLLMLEAQRTQLQAIAGLLPAGVTPSVSAVEGHSDVVALQALCPGAVTWRQLEDLRQAGARRMLVLPVEQMLL